MSNAAVTTPFTQYSKLVTTRLRSRVHGQSFSNAFAQAEERKRQSRRSSPTVRAAWERVEALIGLQSEHRRSFDPTLKARAVQQLQGLPLLSPEEDPHFTVAVKALRVAAYFEAVHAPTTFALLNHMTKHAYLLDGHHMYQLSRVLLELQHPRSSEVLSILLPRMREVAANDVTAVEACTILEVLSVYKVGQQDTVLMEALTGVMRRTIKDLELADVTRCIAGLRFVPSTLLSRPVLQAAESRLCGLLDEAMLSMKVYTAEVFLPTFSSSSSSHKPQRENTVDKANEVSIADVEQRRKQERENRELLLTNIRESRFLIRELVRTSTELAWAPRRVLNVLARSVMVYSDPQPRLTSTEGEAQDEGPLLFDEEEREKAELWAAVPRLNPRDLGFFLRLLSLCNYRHERALRVLSSRIATSCAAAVSAPSFGSSSSGSGSESLSSGQERQPRPVEVLSDLTAAIESLAYFFMTDAAATVTALVREVTTVRAAQPVSFAGGHQSLVIVDCLSRILLSFPRLHFPATALAAAASSPEKSEESVTEALELVDRLLTDDALVWFASGPTCATQPLLTAQLVKGVAQGLGAVQQSLAAAPSSPAESVSVHQEGILRTLALLLEGLGRSGLERSLANPKVGDAAAQRAEASRSITDALSAVRALPTSNARVTAAAESLEATLLKLL